MSCSTLFSLLFFFVLFRNSFSNGNLSTNIRYIIFHEWKRGIIPAQTARNMNAFYGEGSTSEITCRRWFNRFKDGDFSLEDQPRAGRPAELENQRLIELLQEDNRQTTRELAEQLGIGDHSTRQTS